MILRRLILSRPITIRPSTFLSPSPCSCSSSCSFYYPCSSLNNASHAYTPTTPFPFFFQVRTASKASYPRNEEILALERPITWVDNDGVFQGDADPVSLLKSFDRTQYHLVCLNHHDQSAEKLVCRLYPKDSPDLQPEVPKQKNSMDKKKNPKLTNPALVEKEFQIAWGISPHDLKTKLKRMKEFMQKGNRVTVVFAAKKGMAKITLAQAKSVVEMVEENLKLYGKQWKGVEGDMATQLIYYYEGQRGKTVQPDTEESGASSTDAAEGSPSGDLAKGQLSVKKPNASSVDLAENSPSGDSAEGQLGVEKPNASSVDLAENSPSGDSADGVGIKTDDRQ